MVKRFEPELKMGTDSFHHGIFIIEKSAQVRSKPLSVQVSNQREKLSFSSAYAKSVYEKKDFYLHGTLLIKSLQPAPFPGATYGKFSRISQP